MKSNSIFRTAMVLFLAMFTTTVWADMNFGNVLEKEETISMLDGDPVWVYQQKVWFRIKNAPEDAMMMIAYPVLLYHTYYVKGDTTIQDREYKKLYHEYLNENGEYAFNTHGAELVTPIREEGYKILVPRDYYQKRWGDADWYFEMPGSTDNEIRIYDFEMFLTGYKQLAEPSSVELIDKTSRKVFLSFPDFS